MNNTKACKLVEKLAAMSYHAGSPDAADINRVITEAREIVATTKGFVAPATWADQRTGSGSTGAAGS